MTAAPAPDAGEVVVIGGGIAGLVAALELARAGLRPLLLESADRCGGVVSAHTVGGLTLDAGAESFATARPAVAELLGELGLADQIAAPNPVGAWVRHRAGSAPLPAVGFLGIPGRPTGRPMSGGWSVGRAYCAVRSTRCCRRAADCRRPPPSATSFAGGWAGGCWTGWSNRWPAGSMPPTRTRWRSAPSPRACRRPSWTPDPWPARPDCCAAAVNGSGSAVATLSGGLHLLVPALVRAVEAAGGQIRTGARRPRTPAPCRRVDGGARGRFGAGCRGRGAGAAGAAHQPSCSQARCPASPTVRAAAPPSPRCGSAPWSSTTTDWTRRPAAPACWSRRRQPASPRRR